MLKYMVFVGAIVALYGIIIYAKDTIQGKTKPNRVTWLMWSVAPLIATVAAVMDGVEWAVLPVFVAGFGPLLIFISSFFNPNGFWKLRKFDYVCGTFSILALILWAITKQPLVAILFSILSDAFAATPTIIKAWGNPETETIEGYTTGLFSALTSFFAIKTWSISELAFPVYLVIICSTMILVILRGKIKNKLTINQNI